MSDLHLWLKQNEEILKKYSNDEITILAISCGFSRSEVAAWQARITCRECGYVIMESNRYVHVQRRGFCTPGCEEVYDAIHKMEYEVERKRMAA